MSSHLHRDVSSILVVRLREIGDVVFTTPAIRALRQYFVNAHLAYIVEPRAAPVLARNECIDELLIAPRGHGLRGVWEDLRLGRRLRQRRFDLVFDFHGGPRASLLTWMSHAPVRVGYAIIGRGWIYTIRVPRPRALRARHSVENQWDLLRAVGIPDPRADVFPVEMPVDEAVAAAVEQRLAEAGVGADTHLIVIHVSAGNPFRRWPIASFAEVAADLVRGRARRFVILTSGPSELEAAARVGEESRALLPSSDRERIVACGEFSLAELRALCDRAAVYVGGDSGPMHVAATSRVPIVGLYGPTLPERSQPWRSATCRAEALEVADLACRPCSQRTCAPGDFRCLTRIQPEQVVAAAERLLGPEAR